MEIGHLVNRDPSYGMPYYSTSVTARVSQLSNHPLKLTITKFAMSEKFMKALLNCTMNILECIVLLYCVSIVLYCIVLY